MPKFDKTGPAGQGHLTGRGLGPCGNGQPRGNGRGLGRGFGRGNQANGRPRRVDGQNDQN